MQARLAAFHAKLDSVDTRREQIGELSGNLQLQTMPIVGNVFLWINWNRHSPLSFLSGTLQQ
jgi:hypothetical protein